MGERQLEQRLVDYLVPLFEQVLLPVLDEQLPLGLFDLCLGNGLFFRGTEVDNWLLIQYRGILFI
jgi:hypothetical protein